MKRFRRSPRIAAFMSLFFLHATLYATVAAADEGRTVACFVLAKKPEQAQAAAVMSSILRSHTDKLVGVAVRTGAPPGNAQAGVEANRLAGEGFTALNTGNKPGALSSFQKAWDVLAQNPGVGALRLHARVAKGLGVSLFMSGSTTKGKDLIKRSLLLYPKQGPNEYAYSVDVRNLYEGAKREIADMAQGKIEVRSTPAGAEAYLDGVFKGYTPITLGNVPAGSHLVEVVKDGYLRWSTDAVVPEGGRLPTEAVLTASPVKAQLAGALKKVRKSMKQKRFGAGVAPLLTTVGAKEAIVLYASVGGGGFQLTGFYRDLAGTVQPVKATIAQDAEFFKNIKGMLSTTLSAAFQPDGRVEGLDMPPKATVESVMKESGSVGGNVAIDPDSPLFKIKDKDKKESITGTWWFWTIIGVGAAAIAGTVTAIVLATSDDDGGSGAVGNLQFKFTGIGSSK